MINISEIIKTAIISVACGMILAIWMLHGTDAPEWAVISLITITTLQFFIYLSSESPPQEKPNAE